MSTEKDSVSGRRRQRQMNPPPLAPLAAAEKYLSRGFEVVPVAGGSKQCRLKGWNTLRITAADLPKYFPAGSNIGLRTGAGSGNLIDTDLDCAEARAAATVLLPDTGMIGGRESAPDSHWMYRLDTLPENHKFHDPTAVGRGKSGGLLLEVRGEGLYSVVPPSVYPAEPGKGRPTAERSVWSKDGEPATLQVDDYMTAVRAVAAAALLGRYLGAGKRHDPVLGLAGGLFRAGWAVERIKTFVRAVAAASGGGDLDNLLAAVDDTAAAISADKKATGWPALAGLLGPHGETIISQVRDWLGILTPAAMATDTVAPTHEPSWPDPPHEAAYSGLAGDIVRAIEPATEADPVALLSQVLVYFGSVIGRSAHFLVEGDRHFANEFVVLMGPTAKGRKGTSRGRVHEVYRHAAEEWAGKQVRSGLSSGEGLIWNARDPIDRQSAIKERGKVTGYQTEIIDPGESDKRLLIYEPEFATVLKQIERQGNTLSTIIRQAWETGNLQTLTKNSPARATDAHVSIIGHITTEELTRYLSATESANGFANRFLWLLVRRSKRLPEGGRVEPRVYAELAARVAAAIQFAAKVGEVRRDKTARDLWVEVYPQLSEGRPGLVGCLLGRAEAHVMRLAMIYALMERSKVIREEHLLAGMALWDYAERSIMFVFGDVLGDPLADELLQLLRRAGSRGVTRTDISAHLSRNERADRINRALRLLRESGKARVEVEETAGRSAERWFAAGK